MDVKLCNICGNSFSTKTGWFTRHLFDDHDIELKDYVIDNVKTVSLKISGLQTPEFHGNNEMILVEY